ncbi:hypothetical protein HYQ46_000670 [Verticillium longisporum]|nr:hypothetical protein HYQ46_000670 [Verticillium longisporum]
MAILETYNGYKLWHYIPSLPAAIVFAALFGVLTVGHALRMFRHRMRFCLPFVLYATSDSPRFIKGHAISMAFVCMSSVIYMSFWAYFRFLNKKRDEGKEDEKVRGKTEEEIREMGEYNPRFRYTY